MSVALRGAAVAGLVSSLIRVQWLVSTLGGERLAALFAVLPAVANGSLMASQLFHPVRPPEARRYVEPAREERQGTLALPLHTVFATGYYRFCGGPF